MNKNSNLIGILSGTADATAIVSGSSKYPDIQGEVDFYGMKDSVLVVARVSGLPNDTQACKSRIFGFHIHEGTMCTGNKEDPFADAKTHYNPNNCPHPHHAGDMPNLFGNDGYAFLAFSTNRFKVDEIIGKAVIIHSKPDDFTTQPSGNSGEKIACGVIKRR